MFTIDDVATYRTVNGERVPLTDAEREEIAADWNRNMAEREARIIEEKREAALRAVSERLLAQAMSDPTAPAEVKDYAAAIAKVDPVRVR